MLFWNLAAWCETFHFAIIPPLPSDGVRAPALTFLTQTTGFQTLSSNAQISRALYVAFKYCGFPCYFFLLGERRARIPPKSRSRFLDNSIIGRSDNYPNGSVRSPGTGPTIQKKKRLTKVTFRIAAFSHVSAEFFVNQLLGIPRAQADESSSMQLDQVLSSRSQEMICQK